MTPLWMWEDELIELAFICPWVVGITGAIIGRHYPRRYWTFVK